MGAITANDFVAKWRHVELKERSASQSHFNDLCRLLDVPEPVAEDKTGESFCFEKGAKTADGDGWADVWKRGYFAWEYKGRKANLDQALKQLQTYALGLENPPLLIVSDMDRVRIDTQDQALLHAAGRSGFQPAVLPTATRLSPSFNNQPHG